MCGTLRLAAGLIVASMNEMLIDAKEKIKSPDAFALKSVEIKANQLLGLEILSEVYMLAILNMILMGDGSSNILNKDSLKEFNGNYGFGKNDKNAFLWQFCWEAIEKAHIYQILRNDIKK